MILNRFSNSRRYGPPLVLAALWALAVVLWATATAYGASAAYMRPNVDAGEYSAWTDVGASSHWEALSDNVVELQSTIDSSYVTTSTKNGAQVRVGLSDIHLGEASLTSVQAWFYSSSAKVTLRVRDSAGTIASQAFSTPGWHSMTVTAYNLKAKLNELRFEFVKEAENPKIYSAFLKVTLNVPSSGRSVHIGLSADSRSAKQPGTVHDEVVGTGVRHIREDLDWSRVQPSPFEWNWEASDQLFREAAERDLTILPILGDPPGWAVPEGTPESEWGRTYPANNSDFAAFVAQSVGRYGPGGVFWETHPELDPTLAPRFFEIWNEPYYMASHKGELSAARYADLYVAAVKAGEEANKAASFLVEATYEVSKSDDSGLTSWLGAMLAAQPGLGTYVDGIAVHPYPQQHDPFYEPGSGVSASLHNAKRIYEAWSKQSINKPVWITEVGYSACMEDASRCVPGDTQSGREEVKANWLTGLFEEIQTSEYAFVHAMYVYNFREWTPQSEPTNDHEEWYGILGSAKEHLPAWTAFANAVSAYDGTSVPASVITSSSVGYSTKTFKFTADDLTSTFECQLDAGSWTTCVSPKSYTGVSGSGHTFRVRAKNDEATEASPSTFSW